MLNTNYSARQYNKILHRKFIHTPVKLRVIYWEIAHYSKVNGKLYPLMLF